MQCHLLKLLFDEDVSMALTDTEKYLYTKYSDKLVLSANEGELIPDGGAIADAIKTGKNIIKVVPEHVYGVTFKSFAIPIKEENKVVGIFVVRKLQQRKILS